MGKKVADMTDEEGYFRKIHPLAKATSAKLPSKMSGNMHEL
jgi:hypothetical protein